MRIPSLAPALAVSVLLLPGLAAAQGAPPPADGGTQPGAGAPSQPQPQKLAWRGTSLAWAHTATAETLGVGGEVITRNPTYDMQFQLSPRYYLVDEKEWSWVLSAAIGAAREFTNSDVTTDRGEWSLTDATLQLTYQRALYKEDGHVTSFSLRAPQLGFPTSKVSANNGRYFSLGATAGLSHTLPLQRESDTFRSATGGVSLGYSHWFSRAQVPTNTDLERVRMNPEGIALPGDQLSGAAFANHTLSINLTAGLEIHERVSWSNTFGWRPVWKYSFQDPCVDTLTGCVDPSNTREPTNFSVITVFSSDVDVTILDELSAGVGYSNSNLQLGPDGKRRNMFYSPDGSAFSLTITANLDAIYQGLEGGEGSARRPGRSVAGR